MGVLKRWAKATFTEDDVQFSCKVKCLNFREAPKFLAAMVRFGDKRQELLSKHKGQLDEDGNEKPVSFNADDVEALYALIPDDFAGKIFAECVKDIEDLQDEDGTAITSGAQLYEIARAGLVMAVLTEIQLHAAGVSVKEGKDSSSQPGPATARTPAGGDSAAPSTESAGGTEP
jgi:hypothetical protein